MHDTKSEICASAFLWWAKILRKAFSVFVSRFASVVLRIESGINSSQRNKIVAAEEPVLSRCAFFMRPLGMPRLNSVTRAASESTVAVEEPGSLALSRPVDTGRTSHLCTLYGFWARFCNSNIFLKRAVTAIHIRQQLRSPSSSAVYHHTRCLFAVAVTVQSETHGYILH